MGEGSLKGLAFEGGLLELLAEFFGLCLGLDVLLQL
jgi:hypothetical protein